MHHTNGAASNGAAGSPVNVADDKARRPACCEFDATDAQAVESLRERLLEVAGLSEIFKVLGDETRTRIVYLLSLHEVCVHDIAEIMEMSLPAVSHHLRLLKLMRLVKHRREGKNVYYSLDDHHILDLIRVAKEHYDEDM